MFGLVILRRKTVEHVRVSFSSLMVFEHLARVEMRKYLTYPATNWNGRRTRRRHQLKISEMTNAEVNIER